MRFFLSLDRDFGLEGRCELLVGDVFCDGAGVGGLVDLDAVVGGVVARGAAHEVGVLADAIALQDLVQLVCPLHPVGDECRGA